MARLAAGRLRHRITIEEEIHSLDSDGADDPQWLPLLTRVPAEIRPMSGREVMAAQAAQSIVNTRITIRFHSAIRAGMRCVYRETIFSIQAVLPDMESGENYLTLICASGARHVNEAV